MNAADVFRMKHRLLRPVIYFTLASRLVVEEDEVDREQIWVPARAHVALYPQMASLSMCGVKCTLKL